MNLIGEQKLEKKENNSKNQMKRLSLSDDQLSFINDIYPYHVAQIEICFIGPPIAVHYLLNALLFKTKCISERTIRLGGDRPQKASFAEVSYLCVTDASIASHEASINGKMLSYIYLFRIALNGNMYRWIC